MPSTVVSHFLGPWYKWWYGILNKRPNLTPLMKTGIDVSTSPFLHFTFLAFYILIHEHKIIDAKRSWENMIELIKLDLLLFLPICYTNFKFIPPGIWQTVYINAMYVIIVEPVCSMIINDNVQLFDFFFELLPQPVFEKFIEKIGIKTVLDFIIERNAGK
ncbi:unnamed protein product [Oikopleura dioica]|uniref:Uncharacterized protein n=1 Tax=Oikopleura dioica TaxID=34765 RepID=E4YFI4_OIKDI|nr:unnamed protein product [Oikopleura dioica]